ncbi:hypothetical protein ES703_31043 [subsurface metagenome]
MTDRGNVLYKNYYKETTFSGDVLQPLSWPDHQVFAYSEKAGPYNTADRPTGGNEESLVIDYEFENEDTEAYVTVVTPINQENLTDFERFNIILRGDSITGDNIRIYVEVLKVYDEDINDNSTLDGESSINDPGFEITPTDGEPTVIGTDREGKSNGKIDSEDINDNGYLDLSTGMEKVILIGKTYSRKKAFISLSKGIVFICDDNITGWFYDIF